VKLGESAFLEGVIDLPDEGMPAAALDDSPAVEIGTSKISLPGQLPSFSVIGCA